MEWGEVAVLGALLVCVCVYVGEWMDRSFWTRVEEEERRQGVACQPSIVTVTHLCLHSTYQSGTYTSTYTYLMPFLAHKPTVERQLQRTDNVTEWWLPCVCCVYIHKYIHMSVCVCGWFGLGRRGGVSKIQAARSAWCSTSRSPPLFT